MSFCVTEEDILFINKEIFDYHDEAFSERYTALYRDGRSQATDKKQSFDDTQRTVPQCSTSCAQLGQSPCVATKAPLFHSHSNHSLFTFFLLFSCLFEFFFLFLHRVSKETRHFICSNSHTNHHLGKGITSNRLSTFGVRTKNAFLCST